jgi:hypothetical protein
MNGIPYETNMQMKMSGGGPMGGLFSRMGNVTTTSTVESVEVGPLDDSLFVPPAGYKLNQEEVTEVRRSSALHRRHFATRPR